MTENDKNLGDIESTIMQQGETGAARDLLCDTAQQLVDTAGVEDWIVATLQEFMVHSKDALRALREHEDIKKINKRADKKIIVPTNMVVRNRRTRPTDLVLLSSIGQYDRHVAAGILGCGV